MFEFGKVWTTSPFWYFEDSVIGVSINGNFAVEVCPSQSNYTDVRQPRIASGGASLLAAERLGSGLAWFCEMRTTRGTSAASLAAVLPRSCPTWTCDVARSMRA